MAARTAVRERKKEISEEALAELVSRVGPNARQLENEIEKLCLFAGDRKKIEFADVAAICSRNKTARAFALGDALGDRDLPRLLKRLDEELWEMKFDSQKIGNRPALRFDRKSARDVVAQGNVARRLDQADERLQPFQIATGARAGGQIAGGQKVQSAGAESLCALQSAAAGQKIHARANWFAPWICCCAATSGWFPAGWTKRWCCSRRWCKLSRRRRSRLESRKFIS